MDKNPENQKSFLVFSLFCKFFCPIGCNFDLYNVHLLKTIFDYETHNITNN